MLQAMHQEVMLGSMIKVSGLGKDKKMAVPPECRRPYHCCSLSPCRSSKAVKSLGLLIPKPHASGTTCTSAAYADVRGQGCRILQVKETSKWHRQTSIGRRIGSALPGGADDTEEASLPSKDCRSEACDDGFRCPADYLW